MPKARATTLGSCVPNFEPAVYCPAATSEVGTLADLQTIQQDFAPADLPTTAPSRSMPPRRTRTSAVGVAVAATIAALALTGCGSSHHKTTTTNSSRSTSGGYTTEVFASGAAIQHATSKGKASVFQPDDLTKLGSNIFVGFQNGVGPMGETMSGVSDSTIVEFSSSGKPVKQWDLAGHVDGIAALSAKGEVVVTTNEDGNAHLFTIDPSSSKPVDYSLPSLPHNGGLDAISFWHGTMLISASAPGTTGKAAPQASYPAVYDVTLNSSTHKASVRGLFGDEATANWANSSKTGTTKLALTDPDSNEVVPSYAQRFGGQSMLTSQGDGLQIFVQDTSGKHLSVLKLSQAGSDDTAWPSGSSGTLYITDNSTDLIWKVTGPFKRGAELVAASPCDANTAPMSCLASQYLGQVDMTTGTITKLSLTSQIHPKGLLWVP